MSALVLDSPVIYRTYAVVGFGEAKPPRNLLLSVAHGGKAAVGDRQY